VNEKMNVKDVVAIVKTELERLDWKKDIEVERLKWEKEKFKMEMEARKEEHKRELEQKAILEREKNEMLERLTMPIIENTKPLIEETLKNRIKSKVD